jgi:hypothetical protein
MTGLNYGKSYTNKNKSCKNKKEGILYAEQIKKWLVRFPNIKKIIVTVDMFDTEEEANICYNKLKTK